MKTVLFCAMFLFFLLYLIFLIRKKPSQQYHCVDAIVPAYNEAPCIEYSLTALLQNPYIHQVICVNDGSTDKTADVLAGMKKKWRERLVIINQSNTGKGGALMAGVRQANMPQVFLTDADTYVPPDSAGLGYMLAEIENGADAVGGIPSSALKDAGILPHIRATVKLPMIAMKRTFQQWLGGAPFIISGACGMFRTEVLRQNGFSDRTKVEDLDLTWLLISRGYRVRQTCHCVVYPQECNSLREEWRRWRRWIVGYAVCMRLHKSLLLSRFGLFSILPMFIVVGVGLVSYIGVWSSELFGNGPVGVLMSVFPVIWVAIICVIAAISAWHHQCWFLVLLAPFSVFYVLLAYTIWGGYGFCALFNGREPSRDKPSRYVRMVEISGQITAGNSIDKQDSTISLY